MVPLCEDFFAKGKPLFTGATPVFPAWATAGWFLTLLTFGAIPVTGFEAKPDVCDEVFLAGCGAVAGERPVPERELEEGTP
jgi:hypothetical protein